MKKKNEKREKEDKLIAEKLNEEIAEAEGALLECGCCYDKYPFEQLIQCSEGDLFCKSCLKSYVETTVFGEGRSQIKCMNTSSGGCSGYFPESMLAVCLPEATYSKFQQAIARDAIKCAKLEFMCKCHNCETEVQLPESNNIMCCPSCGKETCAKCGEESHVPLRCEEVEKKGK